MRPIRNEALVIDETCFASRKYHRGHRVRESGPQWWFSVVVVGVRDGEVHRGNMYHVNDRTSATLLPIISSLNPDRGYVNITSDAWKAYACLSRAAGVEHHVVNHRVEFVTEAGEHTNAVEGFNGLVKTFMRRYSSQLGREDETMEGKVAAGVCHVNFGLCGVLPLRGLLKVVERWVKHQEDLMNGL